MRKSDEIKEKLIFTAAVICTVIASMLIIAVIILQNAHVLKSAAVVAVICFLLWEFHYSLTHDSLGRKITLDIETAYEKEKQEYTETGRFVFSEDTVCKKFGKIAERFKLEMKYNLSWEPFDLEIPYYLVSLTKKFDKNNFKINITDDCISISSELLDFYDHNYYKFSYNFDLYDDAFREQKARKYTECDRGFEHTIFSSSIMFDDLSDDEIFDIVEKIIEALYGVRSIKYETIEADDGKESFIFYLDAPDYYGYSETTEIGNFKFILNKENGGNQNG